MQFADIRSQLDEVFSRAIETGASVRQNYPSIDTKAYAIGNLAATTVALKNLPYSQIYKELDLNEQYHIKLPDGGLLLFQYSFGSDGILKKHRLGFFPSPILPTVEEVPELYNQDTLYGDIILERIVRFPIRFDFDPENYKQRYHPHSHLTLGQFDNCRIPVSHALSPNTFLLFILRNFYHLLYRRHQNKFDKKIVSCPAQICITEHELALPHLVL